MGGVDQHDWLVSKYSVAIRGKKWYWALFIGFVQIAVVNNWIIYRRIHVSDSLSLVDYYRSLAVTYLNLDNNQTPKRKAHCPEASILLRGDGKDHIICKGRSRCQMGGCNGCLVQNLEEMGSRRHWDEKWILRLDCSQMKPYSLKSHQTI